MTVSPTAEVTPPAVLARLQDAAEQCAAIAPLTAPHVRSFQPEGHNLLGITTSMGEGLAMPPEGFEACLQLLPSDFPAKSALTFTIGPQRP